MKAKIKKDKEEGQGDILDIVQIYINISNFSRYQR